MSRKIIRPFPPLGQRYIPCANLPTALKYAESTDINDPWEWSTERPVNFTAPYYVVERASN